MVIARAEEAADAEEAAERVAYEQSFPAAYCTWLETCPLTDGGYGHLLDDCEAHYAAVMEVESVRHDVCSTAATPASASMRSTRPALPTSPASAPSSAATGQSCAGGVTTMRVEPVDEDEDD